LTIFYSGRVYTVTDRQEKKTYGERLSIAGMIEKIVKIDKVASYYYNLADYEKQYRENIFISDK